jgi:hypothetical protein
VAEEHLRVVGVGQAGGVQQDAELLLDAPRGAELVGGVVARRSRQREHQSARAAHARLDDRPARPPHPTPAPNEPKPWKGTLGQPMPALVTLDGSVLQAPTDGVVRATPPRPRRKP